MYVNWETIESFLHAISGRVYFSCFGSGLLETFWLELFLQDEIRHDFLCTKKEINKIRDDCTLLALVLDLV